MLTSIEKHPCFNKEAKNVYGRVHLPVAPKCNVQCGYCNRKFDCVNESRPGVTSRILTPEQAYLYFEKLKEQNPNLSVVGIAGPGDPLANADETFETIRLINEKYPEMIYCLSTNGVNLPDNVENIIKHSISHVTVTMNTLDPEVAGKIYSWIRYKKKVYRGKEAGELIIKNQLESIKRLKEAGLIVKLNSVILPGVNETGLIDVAKLAEELKVDKMNCLPLIPTADTAFENLDAPSGKMIHEIRDEVRKHVSQMEHCGRCRSDAAGLIGKDLDVDDLMKEAQEKTVATRPYVAVGSMEGVLVNQHLGEMEHIRIYTQTKKGYKVVEVREAPIAGIGDMRWKQMAATLADCRALMVNGIGPKPSKILKEAGIDVIEMTGVIDEGLEHVYNGEALHSVPKNRYFKCGDTCEGSGGGCS